MVANLENDSLGDAHDLRTKAGAVKAFPSLLSQLYPVQSWYHGSPLEYRNPNLEAFASYCPMRFRTQRFKSIALYIYMNAIFNAFDLSNVQEMRFHLAQPVANAYEATKLFLAALKDKGYDLSKNLFLLLGEEALEHQTRAIIEAGLAFKLIATAAKYIEGTLEQTVLQPACCQDPFSSHHFSQQSPRL